MISSPDGISEGSELIWGVTDHRRRRVLTGFLSMTDVFLSLRGEGGRRGRGRATIQPDRSTDRPIKIPIINIMTTLTRFYVIRHRRYVAKSMVLKTGSVSSPSKRLVVVFLLFWFHLFPASINGKKDFLLSSSIPLSGRVSRKFEGFKKTSFTVSAFFHFIIVHFRRVAFRIRQSREDDAPGKNYLFPGRLLYIMIAIVEAYFIFPCDRMREFDSFTNTFNDDHKCARDNSLPCL